MSVLLPWAWLFTLPGMLLTGLGVGRPGAASLGGPAAMLVVAFGWLLGSRAPVELVLPGWLPFLPNGAFHLRVDALSAVMLVVVGAVSLCVYVYSLGYMDDPEYTDGDRRRFFMFLDFFLATMAILVLAGNIAVLLVGWAGVGIASFLLISFRRKLPGSLGAGVQALAANAIGDAALLLALVLVPAGCGDLLTLQTPTCLALPGGAGLLATLILIAAAAKSAQGPLYFWLPSAMAGPTPVSALIHAATMVAAGVYLLVRTHGLLEAAPTVGAATAWLGVITALGGGALSLLQTNFKRGLAYSTVSQLGYMFAGIGFGAPFAALFHLITHASFKALLFLTSGVVIHANEGHEDLSRLHGLRRSMPKAHAAFLIGSLALIGLPGLSGAFSKDAILEAGEAANFLLFVCLFLGVGLTGWYIGRLYFGVFYGPPPEHPPHQPAEPGVMIWPLVPLAAGALMLGYLEWPSGGLSAILGNTVGHAEPVRFTSAVGIFAALLGLATFYFLGRPRREPRPQPETGHRDEVVSPGSGWVEPIAGLGIGLSRGLAGIHSGQLGRYALVSVLGIAILLLLGLLTSFAGVPANIAPSGFRL